MLEEIWKFIGSMSGFVLAKILFRLKISREIRICRRRLAVWLRKNVIMLYAKDRQVELTSYGFFSMGKNFSRLKFYVESKSAVC